jgi:hypothetical protein
MIFGIKSTIIKLSKYILESGTFKRVVNYNITNRLKRDLGSYLTP